MFGEYRVTTLNTDDKIHEIVEWCLENADSMASYPGYYFQEVVWCFETEAEAIMFTLRWI